MKKLILLFMLLFGTLSFATKKLYVGTNAEYKPYEYIENGKIVGFDAELMEAICKKLGYEVVWNNIAFDGLIPALQTNKLDAIIAGMKQTPERQKAVTFSMPYLLVASDEHFILVNKDSKLTSKDELKGLKIGTQLGSVQEEFAKKMTDIDKVILYNSWTGALMDVENNKIDAVILSDTSATEYLKTMKDLKKLDTIKDEKPGASIAFKKGNIELAEASNKAIMELVDEGTYLKILQKYFPEKVDKFLQLYPNQK
ncbi:basic amino acid ABC transporter substrate-binding protein [Fusobacterium perfoetens]|uniref:basic amino acid ABC transporter substrate-binding protein n=1 Tax=Fusobacterium perfoetens TaxID=852 RepID=UPI0004892EF3|nr:basic amino acid ABC transporter substrate-binding protein [Fusobacterium perfoetens]